MLDTNKIFTIFSLFFMEEGMCPMLTFLRELKMWKLHRGLLTYNLHNKGI